MFKFKVYPRWTLRGRRWFWHLKAANGEIIAQGETNGYRHRLDCRHAIQLIREQAPYAELEEIA